MKKILLPTDFSRTAHEAARYAMDFFGHQEVRYILYHVHDLNTLQDVIFDEIEKKMKKELDLFQEAFHDQIITLETRTGSGNVVKNILELSKELQVDYIVMGSEGHRRPVLLGSNASDILRKAMCPVILVPPGGTFQRPESILLPLDLRAPVDVGTFEKIYNELKRFEPFWHIVTVIDHQDSISTDFNSDELKNLIGDEHYSFTFINHNSIVEGITSFADRISPSMMLLFPKKRTLLEYMMKRSVSKRIALITDLPLISVAIAP